MQLIPMQPAAWTDTPEKVINYVSCHDNLTLWDKLKISRPDCDAGERLCNEPSGGCDGIYRTGVPFFLGRRVCTNQTSRKNGEVSENSYNLPYETEQMYCAMTERWTKGLQQYYRGLIAFRKST